MTDTTGGKEEREGGREGKERGDNMFAYQSKDVSYVRFSLGDLEPYER